MTHRAGAISTLPITRSGNTTLGSPTVSGLSATSDILVDMRVTGSGIPAGTYVKKITNASTIELTNNATITGSPVLDFSSPATALLNTMERAYSSLRSVYGAGEHPYTNDGARIVILAYNIQDDYATTQNYVGGFFSPRDLYSNDFTQKLYTDPVAVQQYSSYIGQLGGYSNEMSIINYDLHPGYSGNPSQVNDIVIHELSHLFTYNKRVVKQRLINHDLWIAEGIAENAPHVTIATSSVQALRLQQLASPSVITYYQDAPQMTDFLTWAPKVIAYLQSNLFFNYMRHRAEMQLGGSAATMLAELMTLPNQSIAGVESMIQKYIPGKSFADIYGDYVITHYLMLLGIPLDSAAGIDGAAANLTQYSFSNVGIGSSSSTVGGAILSKYPATIPFNFEAPKCSDGSYGLKPNSYFIFRYKYTSGDITPPNTAGTGAIAGELPLKYVVNMRTENSLIAGGTTPEIRFRTYDAGTLIPMSTGTFTNQTPATYNWAANNVVHILVYNPNKTGSCRALDNALIHKRNHSKWVGYSGSGTQPTPDFDWQTGTGGIWANNQNGGYYRPGGIATSIGGYPNNFLYVLDYNNMSLQKHNLDTGAALGRLGNTTASCPTTGAGWDTAINRYLNGYCAHHFDAPRGVHSDIVSPRNGTTTSGAVAVSGLSATADLAVGLCVSGTNVAVGTKIASIVDGSNITLNQNATGTGSASLTFGCLYVADSNNRRLVQYDAAGNFVKWLGLHTSDLWQDASTIVSGTTLNDNGAETDTKMFSVPWAIVSDSTNLYVLDYNTGRIIRRSKSTGAFVDFTGTCIVGGWNTTSTVTNNFGSTAGCLYRPKGIALTGGNIYVADTLNNRIVRINSSGVWTGWIGSGNSIDGWQAVFPASPGAASSALKELSSPAGIATDGTYLYVTDPGNVSSLQANNRVSRWNLATGAFAGWIGHGRLGWEMTAAAPASDPYASFSYYPPDYYAEPEGIVVATQAQKGTRNDYLFITSTYNGRVTRINLSCVNNPGGTGCDPIYAFP